MKKILSSILVIIFIVSSSAAIFAAQPAQTSEEEYIPIPLKKETNTYHIKIKAVDSAGKPLSGYMGVISIKNRYSNLEFITLPQKDVKLDSNGTMRVPFEIRQPAEDDWSFIENVPMEVTFVVDIFKKGSLTQSKKIIEKTFKLGMFLIHGRTVGPVKDDIFAFEPRYEDAPPIINNTRLYRIYHIASSITVEPKSGDKRDGEFYVLARMPLKGEIDQHLIHKVIHLYWNESTKAGLKYPIRVRPAPEDLSKDIIHDHTTIREKIGQTIELGDIDILSKLEHYKRLRAYVSDFVKAMPFNAGARNKLLADVKSLKTVADYETLVPIHKPPPMHDPFYSGTMSLPGDPAAYFAINPLLMFDAAAHEDPAYVLFFHEMGHLLHTRVVESYLTTNFSYFYNLSKVEYSDHGTWRPPRSTKKPNDTSPNIARHYVSFNEATADFFAYLLYNFMETKHPEFKKSIYYNRGYLKDFDNNEKANAVKHRGGCRIEGVQTTYLISLYSANAKQDLTTILSMSPTAIFADYLRTARMSLRYGYNVDAYKLDMIPGTSPTRTMKEWVITRKLKKGIIGVGDTVGLARKFNIFPCNKSLEIVGIQGGMSKTTITKNGVSSPVDQTLGVVINIGDKIEVTNGLLTVTIVDSTKAVTRHIYAPKGTSFTLTALDEIIIHKGRVSLHGLFRIKPAGTDVTITPKGTVVFVEVTPDGSTKVQVLEGSASISTPEGKTDITEGQAVSIDRGGQVTPAEPLATTPVDKPDEIFDLNWSSSKKPVDQEPPGGPATNLITPPAPEAPVAPVESAEDATADEAAPAPPGSVVLISYVKTPDGGRINDNFMSTASTIFVTAYFKGDLGGALLRISITDIGRGRNMFEIPVLLDKGEEEEKVFELKRPLSGWTPGKYEVSVLDEKGRKIASNIFTISERKFGGRR